MRLIVIDEMSMIGRSMLRSIDLRLRELRPGSNEPFGGFNIVFLGDFGQLPPVMDKVMFEQKNEGPPLSKEGRQSFLSINKAIILTRVERIQGNDDEQTYFREMLLRFRNGEVTCQDVQRLNERHHSFLSQDEKNHFVDATFLVSTKDEENDYNRNKLQENPNPLYVFEAVHSPPSAKKGTTEQAMGLRPCVSLKVDAKVMLRSNQWVAAGLTNGSMGTVHGFLFNPQETYATKSLPVAVCVHFPGYRGPAWDPNHPKVVPIIPITNKWMHQTHFHSRTQIPLSLAHATTIHKSQGWTLERVKVDIGKNEMCSGISFVALSRAKSLKGIMIFPQKTTHITLERIEKINAPKNQAKRKKIDAHMTKLKL